MGNQTTDMMSERRSALDRMAEQPEAPGDGPAFAAIDVNLRDHLDDDSSPEIPDSLVEAVSGRLDRDGDNPGPGAARVVGLSSRCDIEQARAFHERLFGAVWEDFRRRCAAVDPDGEYRTKTAITSDGAIPPHLYGSAWSYKDLHMDRDALVFSHLYGPVRGFAGGALVLVDIRSHMARHKLRFDDIFQWSREPTPGSKPTLAPEHCEAALTEHGIALAFPGPDEVVFVNNLPSAGILHGITPVEVVAQADFVREFHRCSVSGVSHE